MKKVKGYQLEVYRLQNMVETIEPETFKDMQDLASVYNLRGLKYEAKTLFTDGTEQIENFI
jgi:hypothetical protein